MRLILKWLDLWQVQFVGFRGRNRNTDGQLQQLIPHGISLDWGKQPVWAELQEEYYCENNVGIKASDNKQTG